MNKLLPHLPLLAVVFGLLIVQISQHSSEGLRSSVITPVLSQIITPEDEKKGEICSKPAPFSQPEESAWCQVGLVTDIEKYNHVWKWSCIVGQEKQSCHFTEDISYPTRSRIIE